LLKVPPVAAMPPEKAAAAQANLALVQYFAFFGQNCFVFEQIVQIIVE
jgi:hypothetical protein